MTKSLQNKPADTRALPSRKSTARDRVTNGSSVLPSCDGRSIVARRYRAIASAILSDAGGRDHCSETRLQLVRRFAAASVLAEQLEARLARGEEINIAEHASLASTLVRLSARIGIDRIPREVESLESYIASKYSDTSECEETPTGDVPDAAEGALP